MDFLGFILDFDLDLILISIWLDFDLDLDLIWIWLDLVGSGSIWL